MDDRLRESLSVMLDDEADELTVRRVLAHGRDSEEIEAQWQRWQRVREHMRGREKQWSDVDVRAGIWEQLEESSSTGQAHQSRAADAPESARNVNRPGIAALAAMFVVALVVGFGAGQQWAIDETEAMLAAGPPSSQPAALASSNADSAVPSVALQNLDEEQWEQLSDYLLRHAQHNSAAAGHGAVGFARVTSVSPGSP